MLFLKLLHNAKDLNNINKYHLLVISRRKSHFISRVHFVKEICFSEQKIKERFDEILNASHFLANSEIELIKSLLAHISINIIEYK
jgi:hypothetical protein